MSDPAEANHDKESSHQEKAGVRPPVRLTLQSENREFVESHSLAQQVL